MIDLIDFLEFGVGFVVMPFFLISKYRKKLKDVMIQI